ncbi:hypothetical protein ACRALDRAFT_212721 [Sodiomyces alcalophilus JCM 7366]|uniref:uncharacterized protein n=1 Tax=Sodiomyces alcalophilus JCM 7366 TaxID=591952 RepID=UPI0039B5A2B1
MYTTRTSDAHFIQLRIHTCLWQNPHRPGGRPSLGNLYRHSTPTHPSTATPLFFSSFLFGPRQFSQFLRPHTNPFPPHVHLHVPNQLIANPFVVSTRSEDSDHKCTRYINWVSSENLSRLSAPLSGRVPNQQTISLLGAKPCSILGAVPHFLSSIQANSSTTLCNVYGLITLYANNQKTNIILDIEPNDCNEDFPSFPAHDPSFLLMPGPELPSLPPPNGCTKNGAEPCVDGMFKDESAANILNNVLVPRAKVPPNFSEPIQYIE